MLVDFAMEMPACPGLARSNDVPRPSGIAGCAKMGLMSRALWHVNRSPLRYAVKSGVSAWHLGEKLERRRQAQLLNVTAAERNKAEELNRNGYAIVTELMDPAVRQRFAEAGMARLDDIETAEAQQTSNWKKFWVRLLDAEMKDGKLSAENIFVQYALQPAGDQCRRNGARRDTLARLCAVVLLASYR